MGTRNLTLVQLEGKYKVAKYCQWDGNPSGQGTTILKFLRKGFNKKLFIEKVQAIKEINKKEDYKNKWTECGANPKEDTVSLEISDKFKNKYPYLHRDMGGEILRYIQDHPAGLELISEVEFAADSLFCEYAYVVDLDTNTFEVFIGFNKEPLTPDERFFNLTNKEEEYFPVQLLKKFSLHNLPTVAQFIKTCEKEEEAVNIISHIKEKTSISFQKRVSGLDTLNEILENKNNLPLLLGIDENLDKLLEKKLKNAKTKSVSSGTNN